MKRMTGAVLALATMCTVCAAQDASRYALVHEFHVREDGGFFAKTIKELGSPEAQAIVTAACAFYGTDCSGAAGAIRSGALFLGAMQGAGVYITTQEVQQEGEEWRGFYATPDGNSTVCDVAFDVGSSDYTYDSTFNVSLQRQPRDGVSFYAVVPQNRADGDNYVNFLFTVTYVPRGAEAQYNCMQPGTILLCGRPGDTCNAPAAYN